jgi:DNA-binding transcriptional LysR family regulator
MKIDYLEEFATLATNLNFTKVARSLHLSTSVLSKHIASLEKELGIKLFERRNTTVALTPVGRHFFENLLPLLEQFNSLMSEVKSSPEYRQKHLKVILVSRTSPLLKAATKVIPVLKNNSRINVVYSMPTHNDFNDSLKKTDADALITYVSSRAPEGATIIPLYRDPLVAVMPNDHPLARKEVLSFARDLKKHKIVKLIGTFFRTGHNTMEDWCEKFGIKPQTKYASVSSLDDLRMFSGFSDVFITPSEGLHEMVSITPESYKVLPFEEDVYFQIAVVYYAERESGVLKLYIQELKKALAAEAVPDTL